MPDSRPTPRHLRNPRRAYDEHGREMRPATVGSWRALGLRTVAVFCNGRDCRHHGIVSTDPFLDDFPCPDIALRVRCSRCGGRNVQIQIDIGAYYARDEALRKGRP